MFRKQLLYLTNDRLTTHLWEKGELFGGDAFLNDAAGWEAFSRHLAATPNIPVYLLADLIEEDFHRDSLPHVIGGTKKTLAQRRLGQLYRDTPYRHAEQQGRQTEGRRDDIMLFSALTNAELLKPWLDALIRQKSPLAGIYSPALLSRIILKKLDLTRNHLLLVTQQSCGVRQSYFQQTHLKFSRLTSLTEDDTAAATVAQETAKIQQFLASARLLPRGEAMDVVVLGHGEDLPLLQEACRGTPALSYHFLALEDAARSLGVGNPAAVTLCDPIFLHLLGRGAPASHYTLPEKTWFFELWQARAALYGLGLASLAGGVLWTGANSVKAVEFYLQSRQLELETRIAQAQHQTLIRGLPPTAASPQNMKAAVETEQMIARNAPRPAALIGAISQALDAFPQIRVNQLKWQASENSGEAEAGQQAQPPMAGRGENPPPSAILVGIPRRPYQTVLIEGEVAPFRNDYRTALENVRLFAAELGKNKSLEVSVTRQPLDTRPDVRLEGSAGGEAAGAKAGFALKLVLKPDT